MKILQLTKKFPFPKKDGEAWAVLSLARGLTQNGVSIDLFSLNTNQHLAEPGNIRLLDEQDLYERIYTFPVNVKATLIGAFFNLFEKRSYHEKRFAETVSETLMAEVRPLEDYTHLIAESIFMMPHALYFKRKHPHLKILLRSHNVEHRIWERYSLGLSWVSAKYYKLQSARLRRFESKMCSASDAVLTVSDVDLNYLRNSCHCHQPMLNAPIGMPVQDVNKLPAEDRPTIMGFIGSLDWRPNLEGLTRFMKEIWPVINDSDLESVLMVAGRNPSSTSFMNGALNTNFLGEIDDSDIFLQRIDIMVCPLWSGSGTRVKILQALSHGTPVICTPLAAEGLPVHHSKEVMIATSTEEWKSHFESIVKDASLKEGLSRKGHQYLKEHHDSAFIGRQVHNFIRSL